MEIKIGTKGNCILTDEMERFSGQPMLSVDGTAYACNDILQGSITAGQMIANLYNRGAISGEIVAAFIAPLRVI